MTLSRCHPRSSAYGIQSCTRMLGVYDVMLHTHIRRIGRNAAHAHSAYEV